MKLFNNYQKFQNIFAKDTKNFPKIFSLIFLYFLLEIFVNFKNNILIIFIRNYLKFSNFF